MGWCCRASRLELNERVARCPGSGESGRLAVKSAVPCAQKQIAHTMALQCAFPLFISVSRRGPGAVKETARDARASITTNRQEGGSPTPNLPSPLPSSRNNSRPDKFSDDIKTDSSPPASLLFSLLQFLVKESLRSTHTERCPQRLRSCFGRKSPDNSVFHGGNYSNTFARKRCALANTPRTSRNPPALGSTPFRMLRARIRH